MTDLRSDDEIYESKLRSEWRREQAAAKSPACPDVEVEVVNSPGGGTKFDTDKLPVGLMPWPASVVTALIDTGNLSRGVCPTCVELVSRGAFVECWSKLIYQGKTTLTGMLQTSIIGRDRYGAYNWKGLDPDRMYQSAMRHAMHIGEPDEGCKHEDHLGWCLAVLIYFDWQPVEKKPDAEKTD